ncbi:MAG: acyl-CoA dehydrogenase [Crocinitomicaceae bacterium]|nr:acyl-CoA dehydrogenase [Crocinitomicaceae bacterium]|tara:strand:+ start:14291 stop:16081 length:1791 start_codon:yes stop_codon:yes gene_type:complete
METTDKKALMGGEFLVRETEASDIFVPEEYDEEQLMIIQSSKDFLNQEVYPNLDRIDALEEGLMPSLVEKAGELGLLGISVPEELGGFGKNFVTSMLASEATGAGHSFSVAVSAHSGIGTLPILYYGTEEQKAKYIPKLASGEYKGAYCLTEPGSGSDANSGKTKAKLTEDGKHYIINGQKMWITNGGFADVFTVFARIDDDKNLSAFIVDANSEGVSLNPEEKKMGIKGSSTRQVFFNDVKVPVENLLGERDGGFKIALNILNIGRIKLAAAVLGAAKQTLDNTVNYSNERNQFGRPISKYGAIKEKIGKSAIKTFACESATYRASQNIEDLIDQLVASGMSKEEASLKGIEEYAVECAIMKVHGSETLDYVVDEGVQIHGGMGFSAESKVERAYRDSRINRIFEGTNEINRMLAVEMMLRKAMKGKLDLMGPAQKVAGELMSIPDFGAAETDFFKIQHGYIKNFKKAVLMVAGSAAQKLMMELSKEQEVLLNIADMLIETYVAESTLLRVEKLVAQTGEEANALKIEMAKAYIWDAAEKINHAGKEALMAFADGDELKMMLMGIKRFTKIEPFNVKNSRRAVAESIIEANKYIF